MWLFLREFWRLLRGRRQDDVKCRPFTGARDGAERPAVLVGDRLADREADAGARILVEVVEPFERFEDFPGELLLEADALVGDGETGFRVAEQAGADIDRRRGAGL